MTVIDSRPQSLGKKKKKPVLIQVKQVDTSVLSCSTPPWCRDGGGHSGDGARG